VATSSGLVSKNMSNRSNRLGAFLRVGLLGVSLIFGTVFHLAKSGAAGPVSPIPVPAASSNSPLRVSAVSIRPNSNGPTVVEVQTSDHPSYHVSQLEHPSRLVIDVDGAVKATSRKTYIAKSPLLYRVRVGQLAGKAPSVVRVVLDLRGRPHFEVNDLPAGIRIEIAPNTTANNVPAAMIKPEEGGTPRGASGPQGGANPPVETASVQQPRSPAAVTPQNIPAPSSESPPPSVQVSQPPQSGPTVLYVTSPFRSPAQNERLLDTLGLRVVLNFGYRRGKLDEAHWKTEGVPGVEVNRLFFKPLSGSSYRTIELAATTPPQGQSEIAIYGEQVDGGTPSPNPDVMSVQQVAGQEISTLQQAPTPSDMLHMSYSTYHLSYIKADRAIALLKTMGYTTVEYNEQAGEGLYDKVYNPLKLGTGKPPIIIKLIDASKTSLQQPTASSAFPAAAPAGAPAPSAQPGMGGASMVSGATPSYSGIPEIGGSYLSDMTAGDPQQRLLIVYDKNDPESMQSLVSFLQDTVDVPSRQIMIEALVIELSNKLTRQLGVSAFTQQSNQYTASSQGLDPGVGINPGTVGSTTPFVFSFDKNGISVAEFQAQLSALLHTDKAQILSNPSVLVLDDRQARIQIAAQQPIGQQVATLGVSATSVNYVPIGIVLNLRPRVNEDGTEITMQTETIVSAKGEDVILGQGTSAPVINNREVQSIVRVADNTPFIIGGLTSNTEENVRNGIPLLSQIPGLGALFRNTTVVKNKQEVIIVVTPHVIPPEDKYFSYVIPKDSNEFDRYDWHLFRNVYRIRGEDLFDLEFVYDSNVYKQLVNRVKAASVVDPSVGKTQPFASVMNGGVPGEDVLVRRMLWEIIRRTKFERYVDPDNIIFFKSDPSAAGGAGFELDWVSKELARLKDGQNAFSLSFEAQPQGTLDRPLVPPKAVFNLQSVTAKTFPSTLLGGNDRHPDGTEKDWMVLLSKDKNYSGIERTNSVTPVEFLQSVIVLKRVLELNKDMPLTLSDFHIGRQIIFPSQEELQEGNHLVDREVAKLFYEVYNYYPVFEQRFDQGAREMSVRLDQLAPRNSTP
jgi:general secretion pathway protein D